jgi:putative RecB family exonuclease
VILTHLSPSRIETFDQCQLKYHAIYEEKLPEGPPHPLTVMGGAVHKAGELGVQQVMDGQAVYWGGLVRKACASYGVSKPNMELAQQLMQNAIDWGYLRNVEHCKGLELAFYEELPDGTKVKGIVDRLDILPKFTDIIDLKTQQRAFDEATLSQKWQTVVYNWAVRKRWEVQGDVRLSYWVLRHRVQRCWMTKEDAKNGQDMMMVKANEIRRCDNPQPSPSPLCQWCPKQPTCPASKEGVKDRFKRKFQ